MVSLITVGMNHLKFIEVLYSSLYGIGMPQTEIEAVYVDNCSTDGSVEFLREKYPQVKIIVNTEPLGFGENNNKGVMASTGDFIGIVNPDVVIQGGSIDLIMDYVQQNKNALIVPQLLNPDGSVQYSVRKFATLKMMLSRWLSLADDNSDNKVVKDYLCKDIDNTKIQEVDWAIGAAMFMSRETYARLGGFDQRYFLYVEDEDMCLRAWKMDIPVIYYPDAKLIHNHLRGSRHVGKKTLYHLKSLFTYFRRHGINVKRNNKTI